MTLTADISLKNERGLDDLRKMKDRYPDNVALLEFYQDVSAIVHHDPTRPCDLDWSWITNEAYRKVSHG